MDRLRVAKVDGTLLQSGQTCWAGTLHLTQHHLIFSAKPDHQRAILDDTDEDAKRATQDQKPEGKAAERSKEIWIAYSMLWRVTRLSSIVPLDSSGKPNKSSGKRIYPLSLYMRNFESVAVGFESEAMATDVFESLKAAAIVESPQQLYAFFHAPDPALRLAPAGWRIYDFKAEFARQGVGHRTKAWRFCDVNAGYGFSPTYPSLLCVPSRISDSTIRYAAKYRSKERIPALTYLHWGNLASITRSSQPMVGLNNRSLQDEKLVEAVFSSHLFADPLSPTAQAASTAASNVSASGNAATERGKAAAVYGATTTNLIIDARPTTNAMANRAKGAGTENMEHYKGCKKVYLGIDNIHVMRDSLNRVTEALRAAQAPATFGMQAVAAEQVMATEDLDGRKRRRSSVLTASDAPPLDHVALKRSAWLKHISALLEGTLIITRNVHVNNSHVLIHCSDGWDRTSQLAGLAQVCLDPYFRTMRGFAVLVEKDWVSFGHRFWDRCGHASSDKYFVTADGYGEESSEEDSAEEANAGDGFDAQAAANAFWGFTKQLRANFQSGQDGHGKRGAHLKETSPVFHQFLDCVWQAMRQYPKRFEFNETWLLDLYDHHHECKFGNFLFNCESERNGFVDGYSSSAPASSRTCSVWDEMLDEARRERYLNPRFEPALDTDTKRASADMGVLLPNSKDVGFWGGLFRREPHDINQLVRAEAEERKRQVQELEKQRQEELLAASSANAVGPSEVDGVTIGPAVAAGESDPVLRPGVVDVNKFDTAKLAYKPRAKPVAQPAPMRPSGSQGTLTDPASQAPVNGANPMRSPTSDHDEFGLNAQEAANKMKNMFLGWGARLQDAYATATTVPPSETSDRTTDLPRVVEANQSTSADLPSSGPSLSASAARSAVALPAGNNPWAAGSAQPNRYDGLPNTLQGNPLDDGDSRARQARTNQTIEQSFVNDPAQSLAPAGGRAKERVGHPRSSDLQGSSSPSQKERKEDPPNYDPLGVGLG